MSILLTWLKEIRAFIYILIFLLIINLLFNVHYDWYGISLIVRIYLFVFSFYLIFTFSSIKLSILKERYKQKYGRKGELMLFLESRIFPFFFIYLITIIFTLIDYIRIPNWPWNPILSLLNGRYSNLVIYSLLLLLILKLKKKPSITILLFLFVFIIYFISDKIIYSTISSGTIISIIKITKYIIFFYFLFYEFYGKIIKSTACSLVLSFFIYFSIIGFLSSVFRYSNATSFPKKEAGLLMLRFGYTYPLQVLKDLIIKESDFHLFLELLPFAAKYNIDLDYKNTKWGNLLLQGPVYMADLISVYFINKDIALSYDKIVAYALEKSKANNEHIEKAHNFIALSSKIIKGNEDNFFQLLKNSNKKFKLWGIAVLAEKKNIESMPLLIKFLTDIDVNISLKAYLALKKITGLDPEKEINKQINDPDTIIRFKQFYLLHCKIN